MVFIAFVTRCHSVAFRFLTSRRTRTLSGARQGQLGQLVPQQGVAGKAAAPTAASRTNPTFFMGHRSALLLQYADRLLALTRQKIARRRARDKCFSHTMFSNCSSICLHIRGVIPSSIRAFQPGIKKRKRVSSRVVEGSPKSSRVKRGQVAARQPKWQVAPRRKATAVGSRQEVFSQSA